MLKKSFHHLILIGFPNAGKTFFSQKIVSALECNFFNIDDLTPQQIQTRIPLLRRSDPGVVNVSGAIIYHPHLINELRKFCFVIHLSCDFPTLAKRKNLKTKKIQFRGAKSYQELYDLRLPLYQQYSDAVVYETKDWKQDLKTITELAKQRTQLYRFVFIRKGKDWNLNKQRSF